MDTYKARDMMRRMAESAWVCGDPGMQFDTTVNDWHPCPNTARINASNPCSEYMFLDDSACNLASLNLMKFYSETTGFDVEAYRAALRIVITAQEIVVDFASYPTPAIEKNSHAFRPLGIGYANLGALLMARGVAYDSEDGRHYAAAITSILSGESYAQSARIAEKLGPFAGYAVNEEPFLRVIDKHRRSAYRLDVRSLPADLADAACKVWDEAYALGQQHGYRNAQITVLAPTGTIAFMMDCDTTGIEPDIALVKYKKLVGGGMLKIVNNTVPTALKRLGYDAKQVKEIVEYINENDTIEGAPHLIEQHLTVFDCAFKPANGTRSIHYMGHLKMMGAVQPFISGAISKTINMPTSATVEEIEQAYYEAWKLGLKAVAVYRDGCKRSQPLSTGKDKAAARAARRRPDRGAPQAPRRARVHHPQILHRRPRGLHHRRQIRRRQPRRDLHHHGQGRLDHLRPDGQLRHHDLPGPPARRAAAAPGRQVHPHPLRALGLHQKPRDPDGQVDHGLHLQVAGDQVPQPRRARNTPASSSATTCRSPPTPPPPPPSVRRT